MNKYELNITPIAYIYNDFTDSFGIPRQGGLAKSIRSELVFTPRFRDKNALRGIEQYSHLWLIWGFSDNFGKEPSPTVRPPKLGGNKRVGVFATRSPFRPNFLGLTCVELAAVKENEKNGLYLEVLGADIKSGTPIYDIKPYLPYADIKEDARGGFAEEHKNDRREVLFSNEVSAVLSSDKLFELEELLSLDPTPQYKGDGGREYGITFCGYDVKFSLDDGKIFVKSAAPIRGSEKNDNNAEGI